MRTGFGSQWILVVRLLGRGALPTAGSDSNDKLTMFRIHARTSDASRSVTQPTRQ